MNHKNGNYCGVAFGWNRATTLAIPGPLGIRRYTRHAILLRFIGALALLSILLDPTQSYAQSP